MENPTNDHYDAIAADYDDMYSFLYGPLVKKIIPLLDLNPDVRIVDIGGGTGAVAEFIFKLSGTDLKNPICVVEPSPGLISKAKTRPNIIPVIATAEGFFSSFNGNGMPYNRFIFCQSVHHVRDQNLTFKNMYDAMPKGAVCVILGAQKTTELPLWKSVRENFGSNMSEEVDILRSCGFDVEAFDEDLVLHLTKREWYEKIRKRIFSCFHPFTDEQMDSKIEEIDKTLLSNVKSDEQIEMIHKMRCIVSTKS